MPAKGEHVGMHGLSRRMFGTAVATTALVAMTGSIATADDDAGYVEMTLGNPDAQLVVTEYLMFTCPHCKNFHETVYPRLKQEYIDTGRILYRVREAYFNRPALWAAMIARCGGQDKYFGISDMLFARQDDWSRQESPTRSRSACPMRPMPKCCSTPSWNIWPRMISTRPRHLSSRANATRTCHMTISPKSWTRTSPSDAWWSGCGGRRYSRGCKQGIDVRPILEFQPDRQCEDIAAPLVIQPDRVLLGRHQLRRGCPGGALQPRQQPAGQGLVITKRNRLDEMCSQRLEAGKELGRITDAGKCQHPLSLPVNPGP